MKLFYDLLPIILFFVAYKVFNIYVATGVAIAAVLLQVGTLYIRGKKPDLMNMITLAMVVVLGGATLLFRNELFIKWKPTAVYWILGTVFAVTPYFSEKTIVQKMLEASLTLSSKAWNTLNASWVGFFYIMGLLNVIVVYSCDTDTWVNFKLFGTLVLTLVFVVIQALLVTKMSPESHSQNNSH